MRAGRSELDSNTTYANLQICEGDARRMMIRARHVCRQKNLNGGLARVCLAGQLKIVRHGNVIFIASGQ